MLKGDSLVAEEVYNLSDEFRRIFVLPVDDSISGRAVTNGETVAVDDVDAEPLVDSYLVAGGRLPRLPDRAPAVLQGHLWRTFRVLRRRRAASATTT